MNYNKIKILIEERNIGKNKLAGLVDMTPYGLSEMIKEERMKVETLEKIAEVLKVPIGYFFDEDKKTQEASEPVLEYKMKADSLKDELIEQLKTENKFLREMLSKK